MTRRFLVLLLLSLLPGMTACEEKKNATDESAAHTPATDEATQNTDKPVADEKKPEAAKAPESQAASANPDSKSATILGVGSTPENIKPGESNVYGSNFTIIEPPITLASAITRASSEGEGPYKVEATVEKVCQAKGCWFTLKGEGVELPIRVKMKDYKFFVPRNATNMPVVLEGTFKRVVVPQAEAQHYADDEAAHTGKPAKKIEGDQDSWAFTATAVQIDNKKS